MSRRTKRILILLSISIVSIIGILYFTVDERTIEALADVKPIFLLALLGSWIAYLLFDAVAIMFFTRGTDERIGFMPAFKTTTVRMFFNIITPFAFGGQPFSIVSLGQEGIPSGKGTSIVVMKLITLSLFTQIGALLSFIFFNDKISSITAINKIFMVSGFIGAGFILLITFGFIYPHLFVKTVTTIGKLLHFFHILKDIGGLRRKVILQACDARRSFKRYFSHHILYFIAGTLCNGAMYFSQIFIMWLIFLGLGQPVPFLTSMVLTAMLIFLNTFMPTPGAIGFGEAFFFLLFSGTIPSYMIGIAVVLWRFFFHYLSAVLGVISSSNYVSNLLVRKKPIKKRA